MSRFRLARDTAAPFDRIRAERPLMYCQEHPQSPGVGVCVACQTVVCASCTTRLQGRNFCAACLQRRAGPAAESIPAQSGAAIRFLVAGLAFAATVSLLSFVALAGFLLHRMG